MYKIIIDLEAYNLSNKKPPGAAVKSCPHDKKTGHPEDFYRGICIIGKLIVLIKI